MTTGDSEGISFGSWEESTLNMWYLLLYVKNISIVLIMKKIKKITTEDMLTETCCKEDKEIKCHERLSREARYRINHTQPKI